MFGFLPGRFCFPEAEWRDVSNEAKDLIRNLLVKEASKRLSAEAVLNHPWIRVADEDCDNEKRHRALKTPGIIRRYVFFGYTKISSPIQWLLILVDSYRYTCRRNLSIPIDGCLNLNKKIYKYTKCLNFKQFFVFFLQQSICS